MRQPSGPDDRELLPYFRQWERRAPPADCIVCGGDRFDAGAGDCCANTGLEAIPWTELFRRYR